MKRPSLAVGVSLFCCMTFASLPAFANALQDAGKQFRKGQYPAAMKAVNAWLGKHPKDAQGRFLKGLILTEAHKTADAIKVFAALTKDYPQLPEPYNNLAVIYASQGQYEKAKDELEAAIQTHPSYAIAHENLGDIYAKLASQAYDKALQLDKSNAKVETKLELIKTLFSKEQAFAEIPHAGVKTAKAEQAPEPEEKPLEEAPKPEAKPVEAAPKPEAKPVEAAPKPEAKPAELPKEDKSVDEAKAVVAAVESWARAWSSQNLDAYFGHYAEDFDPADGKGLKHWKALRKARIARPKYISVKIADPEVSLKSGKHATIRFMQSYESPSMKETTVKILSLSKTGGKWLIDNEKVGH